LRVIKKKKKFQESGGADLREFEKVFELQQRGEREREFFTDNLLVRIHFIIVMIRWTGLAPWEFEFPFPGSLASTFLERSQEQRASSTWEVKQ